MIKIEKKDLKLFLEERRKKLEIKRFSGIGEIVSGVSLIITLLCSDFNNALGMSAIYFEFSAWLITFVVLFVGVYSLIKGMMNPYTINKLYDEIIELDTENKHIFNIIVLKNSNKEGRYLLFKSKRWGCKLFPNYKALGENYDKTKEQNNICKMLSDDIGVCKESLNIQYRGYMDSEKYSFGDKVNKKYVFHFYFVELNGYEKLKNRSFKYNGKKFYWMTIDKMLNNKNIKKKNKDVIDYVRGKVSVS